MKKLLSGMMMLLMAAVVAFPPAALATTILSLSDGATTVVITDGGAGDSNPVVGAITYLGGVGANWTLNVVTGITKPFITNGPYHSAIDVNSVDSSLGAGTLTIMFNDTDFNLISPATIPNSAATMLIGGTTGPGTLTYQAYFDNTDASVPPLAGTLIDTLGPFPTGAFSGTSTSKITTNNPFSLTEVLVIHHKSAGLTSFNAALDVVPLPLPASVLLLGSGVVGLVGLGWRRSRKES